jgi:hypothetical protein
MLLLTYTIRSYNYWLIWTHFIYNSVKKCSSNLQSKLKKKELRLSI